MTRYTLLFIFLTLFFTNCSNDISGGSSSSENAKVLAGVILDTNGIGLSKAVVELRATDAQKVLAVDTTSENGIFHFDVSDTNSYTVLSRALNNYSAFSNYIELNEDTISDTITLLAEGEIKIRTNLNIDLVSGKIDILGTGLSYPLTDAIKLNNGEWEIDCDNLPAGVLPAVTITTDTGVVELSSSLTVFPAAISSVEMKDNEALHQWNVPITVSVKQSVADNNNGIDNMKPRIIKYLDSASKLITEFADLPGEFHFYADSFSIFSGSGYTEGIKNLGTASQRLIYTDSSLDERATLRSSVDSRLHFFWLYSNSNSFFQQWDLELLTRFLVEGRGAIQDNYLTVNPGTIPIKHTGYTPASSIMNKNSFANYMTDYTKLILLHNRDKIGNERDILTTSLPETIRVTDTTALIDTIYVFGGDLYSGEMAADTLYKSIGKNSGNIKEFDIPCSLFLNNTNIKYGNLMLLSNSKSIKWLPLSEVSEGWFNGNKKVLNIIY